MYIYIYTGSVFRVKRVLIGRGKFEERKKKHVIFRNFAVSNGSTELADSFECSSRAGIKFPYPINPRPRVWRVYRVYRKRRGVSLLLPPDRDFPPRL